MPILIDKYGNRLKVKKCIFDIPPNTEFLINRKIKPFYSEYCSYNWEIDTILDYVIFWDFLGVNSKVSNGIYSLYMQNYKPGYDLPETLKKLITDTFKFRSKHPVAKLVYQHIADDCQYCYSDFKRMVKFSVKNNNLKVMKAKLSEDSIKQKYYTMAYKYIFKYHNFKAFNFLQTLRSYYDYQLPYRYDWLEFFMVTGQEISQELMYRHDAINLFTYLTTIKKIKPMGDDEYTSSFEILKYYLENGWEIKMDNFMGEKINNLKLLLEMGFKPEEHSFYKAMVNDLEDSFKFLCYFFDRPEDIADDAINYEFRKYLKILAHLEPTYNEKFIKYYNK